MLLLSLVSRKLIAAAKNKFNTQLVRREWQKANQGMTSPRNMKQLRNLHHKQLQLSRISHDDMYNLHWYIHKIITFPSVCHPCIVLDPWMQVCEHTQTRHPSHSQSEISSRYWQGASHDQCHWSQTTKPDCSVTVPVRAFRTLVGGTVPFHSGQGCQGGEQRDFC